MPQNTPPVIFEMLRSFLELARTLNVSDTAEQLGLTRQTVKRHVKHLESIKGKSFFELENRQYTLTSEGANELAEAQAILERLNNWLNKDLELVNGLPRINYSSDSVRFSGQRYPTIEVHTLAPPLLRKGLQNWVECGGQLEHPKLRKIRPFLLIYRKFNQDWICVEIGEKSAYSSWLGSESANSSVGLSFFQDPISSGADDFMVEAYENVWRTGGLWYDHITAKFNRYEDGVCHPANYQRLVMALQFPDGERAIGTLSAMTNNIKISGIDQDEFELVPEQELREFNTK